MGMFDFVGDIFGGGGDETVTQTLDPSSQRHIDLMRQMGRQGANQMRTQRNIFQGPNQFQNQAMQGFAGMTPGGGFDQFMQQSGQLAGQAGQFDPSSIQGFMNPYLENVIGGAEGMFQHQRDLAQKRAKQAATLGGAWGGSGGELLQAQGISNVDRQASQVMPQLYQQGHSEALNAALGQHGLQQQQAMQGMQNLLSGTQFSSGLDFQKNQAMFSGGEAFRQMRERQRMEPAWRRNQMLNMMGQSLGPTSGTTTATQSGGNPLAGAFGGAMTGAQVGGPIGGLIGGGLGLLGGLF